MEFGLRRTSVPMVVVTGGFVLIHKTSELSRPTDAVIFSPSPLPELFMIWHDDRVLSLVRASNSSPLNGPSSYQGISIVYSTYQTPTIDDHPFRAAKISKKDLTVKSVDTSAEFVDERTKTGKRCILSISAKDGVINNKVGVRIDASINPCNRAKDCAGLSSEFWVEKKSGDREHHLALTSATISDVPSYNHLPSGNQNSAVKGTFAQDSAVDLMNALGSELLNLQYSMNFFDFIISYNVETNQISTPINSFKACIGDGDFSWMIHEKNKPQNSERPNR